MKFDDAGAGAKMLRLEGNMVDPVTGKIVFAAGTTVPIVGDIEPAKNNGQITASYQPIDFYTKAEILNWLGGYSPAAYRHDEGPQEIPVEKDEFIIRNFGTDHGFSLTRTLAGEEGAPNEISTKTTTSNRKVLYHRVAFWAPRNVVRQANYDILKPGLQLCSRVLMLNRELHVWGPAVSGYNPLGVLVDSANWDTQNTSLLGAGFQWGNASGSGQGADSDPLYDLDVMQRSSLNPIQEVWMNRNTWSAMLRNSAFQDGMRSRLGATEWNPSMVTTRQTQEGRENAKINFYPWTFKIVDSQFKHPNTGAMAYTMPDGYVLGLHKAPSAPGVPVDGNTLATAYMWTRTNPTTGGKYGIRTAVNEMRGHGGELYIVEMGYECNRVGDRLGYLLRGAIQ